MCKIIKTNEHTNWNGKLVNVYNLILNETYEYTGNHPIEEHHYYEKLIEEKTGEYEFFITNIKKENKQLIIQYEEQ